MTKYILTLQIEIEADSEEEAIEIGNDYVEDSRANGDFEWDIDTSEE